MEKRSDKVYSRIGIYGIQNKINGYMYIGKTGMNFGDRWDSHRSLLRNGKHFNQYLQRAWNKYGENNFDFVVVEDCNIDELDDKERYYIQLYKSQQKSYNLADGGEGGAFLGKHLPEETKRKIGYKNRIHMTGRKLTEETRNKMSQSQKDRYEQWTEEDRQAWGKMSSEKARGYAWNDESKKKMMGNKNGATHTPEEIKEIRHLHEKENKSCKEIAEYFNLSYMYVYNIITYRRWANI
jgi:group I intron endonuclease